MNNCIGCDLAKGVLPSIRVYEDDLVIALMDIEPINDGHVLIITKEHRIDIDELTDEESIRVMQVSKIIIRALRELYDFDGYSVMQNGCAFNDITHYHYHVFPRYTGDGFGWKFNDASTNSIETEGKRIKSRIDELLV
jgi:histidine triad (HIT) family protein